MNWLLPEHIADILPPEAARIESLRRKLLDLFRVHGYELVGPPFFEHLDSLLTGSGQDLDLRTFKLVDQLSGRTLGVRADITPQVARIDAHLLNRQGVTRLCYCGSVLHTTPASPTASREPIQLGAELYGHAGIEADREVIRLMAEVMTTAGVQATQIDLGHVGVFRTLVVAAGCDAALEGRLLRLLQVKDVPGLRECSQSLAEPLRSSFLRLPDLYGGPEILTEARRVLPALPEIDAALSSLHQLQQALPDLTLSFDLADLRGYHYHNGVVFATYHAKAAGALALGGRYDGVGQSFGRARPATGFSLDLRELARVVVDSRRTKAILAPYAPQDTVLRLTIAELRQQGEIVIERLPGDTDDVRPSVDRQLICRQGQWLVEDLNRNG
ncbi:MAG TPA: ATP phosphoribosyltransferase regulatory subunit [Accumulibacter sp.]|nr:ATP phosphoribosyltransferase regulatory subunit [Accumulibacter sp.]HMW16401.1 ATP phosphoribosyltransferase regulatory subunit [Accumulibacter sp.]HMX23656.1 ATP phosphoribosyltransferase regulatory subunit [Accumulibacter sp.]HMY06740.1 ATP phosphoribosyltransferase regulatory subunit [Accumulibacter sp.]HNC16631.1 ATP phosphoribosyltransferase regulatory subunit [Accumulibacter sp.]